MHSILQVLKKSKYTVPQEKAKTQTDVKMDLDALFHLPAALRGSFLHISYLFLSHCSGVENAVSWSTLIQPYPMAEAAALHTLALAPHLGSPACWAVPSWRKQGHKSVLLGQIEPIFMIMSSCHYSTSGKRVWSLHVQVDSQDCKTILAKLQNLHSGLLRCLVTITTVEKNSYSNTCQSKIPSHSKISKTRALWHILSQATGSCVSVQRVRNKGKLALLPKTPDWLNAEHLRLHTAFLNGLASHVICYSRAKSICDVAKNICAWKHKTLLNNQHARWRERTDRFDGTPPNRWVL